MGDIGIADGGARISGSGMFFDIGTNLVPGSGPPANLPTTSRQHFVAGGSLTYDGESRRLLVKVARC